MGSKCGRGEVVPSHGASQVPSPGAAKVAAVKQSGSGHMSSLRQPATIINYTTSVQDETTFLGSMEKMKTTIFFFFVLFIVVYFVFSVYAFFMENMVKQNRLFSAFLKKVKICLMEMALLPSFFKLRGI